MKTKILLSVSMLAGLSGHSAMAFERLDGTFVAKRSCAAMQSLKRGSNPGGVRVEPERSYPVTGLNAPDGRYVQLRIDEARPNLRWVDRSCGELAGGPPVLDRPEKPAKADSARYLLAISWQPAFCETKPDKPECRSQTASRFDADHFTLHGLWPQPESRAFCNVSAKDKENDKNRRWDALPEPDVAAATRARLEQAMPGVQSNLQRHEYTKHGSCFPATADAYFRTALHLLEQVNASKLRELLAGKIGGAVDSSEMARAFEESFGSVAGQALGVQCVGDINSRRTLISEIRIPLRGTLTESTSLKDALDTSENARRDCGRAVVDPVGLQ